MSRGNSGAGGFLHALVAGLQWHMLLLWVVLMWLPTAIASWPVAAWLDDVLGDTAHAQAWAGSFHGLAMTDLLLQSGKVMPAITAGVIMAVLVTLLFGLFFAAVIVSAAGDRERAGFGALMRGGLQYFWRMLRVSLWSVPLWLVALGIGALLSKLAENKAELAVLQSQAELWQHIDVSVSVILLVVVHVILTSARAQFAADPGLTSATRAMGRALRLVFTRPVASFGRYLGVAIIGILLLFVLTQLRMQVLPASSGLAWLAWLVVQLIVVVTAWMKIARLYALAGVAPTRRGASGLRGVLT